MSDKSFITFQLSLPYSKYYLLSPACSNYYHHYLYPILPYDLIIIITLSSPYLYPTIKIWILH